MTLPPEDRDLIERVLGCKAPRTFNQSEVAKLLAAARAEAAPVVDERMIIRGGNAARRLQTSRFPGVASVDEIVRAVLEAALNPSREVGQ